MAADVSPGACEIMALHDANALSFRVIPRLTCNHANVRLRGGARLRVKIISARQFKCAHERCVKAALEDPAHSCELVRVHA